MKCLSCLTASIPMKLGSYTLPARACGSLTQHPPHPVVQDFYRGFIMETWLVISSISSPTHFSRGWGVELKVWSFSSWLGLSGDGSPFLKLSISLPGVAFLEQMTLLWTGITKGLRNSVLETRIKNQKLEQKIFLATLSPRKVHPWYLTRKVRSSVTGTRVKD